MALRERPKRCSTAVLMTKSEMAQGDADLAVFFGRNLLSVQCPSESWNLIVRLTKPSNTSRVSSGRGVTSRESDLMSACLLAG